MFLRAWEKASKIKTSLLIKCSNQHIAVLPCIVPVPFLHQGITIFLQHCSHFAAGEQLMHKAIHRYLPLLDKKSPEPAGFSTVTGGGKHRFETHEDETKWLALCETDLTMLRHWDEPRDMNMRHDHARHVRQCQERDTVLRPWHAQTMSSGSDWVIGPQQRKAWGSAGLS